VALLFDTSAVIGLIERQSDQLRQIVARSASTVMISTMTLGELERGVRSRASVLAQHTLDVASTTMEHLPIDELAGPACFGFVSSSVSQKVGGIDCWIATAAVVGAHQLVTQDSQLASEVEQIDWTATAWLTPQVTYVPVAPDVPANT